MKGHGSIELHQVFSFSKLFNVTIPDKKAGFTKRLFIPGCSLSSYSPHLVKSTIEFLQEKLPGTGAILKCCGKPTLDMGQKELFLKRYEELQVELNRLGVEEVITACQNCYVTISKFSPSLRVKSLWIVIPDIVITLANAWVFGWAWGAVISWTGAMLGAALAFFISKIYGRPVAEKFVGKRGLKVTDGFFEKYGEHTILIARLLPFVSFHAISYAAGLTGMSFWSFFWATGIGQIPATIVYSLLGQNINKASKLGFWAVCGLAALIAFAIKKYLMEKKKTVSKC
ncbi:VTT domain-containing protein [Clostridium sp. DJ247]|uniref:VTT domain-containing protein n=1 Tax=Clostridium sp. DJ247 TaxID=2726188 RepID=UPI001F4C5CC6|nr:VTT domain-containing protein [Clostridium sp. DJ247]MBC2582492.1 hypothetical protein [Clostridium sp. DJ247]